MIAPVRRASETPSAQRSQKDRFPLRALRALRFLSLWLALGAAVSAHDFERTQVALTLARDGSFVLDVTNDSAWLSHRLVPFSGPFADRVVLFVDSREIRLESTEFIAGPAPLATYRMLGRMPLDARTLRFFYGLVIDPYPLTIRRADGRIVVEDIAGDAWSRTIDLSGQFQDTRFGATAAGISILVLLAIPLLLRVVLNTKDTKDTKSKTITV